MATSTAPTVANEPPPVRPGPLRLHSGSAFFWGIVLILAVGFLAWFAVGYFGTDRFEDLDQKRVKERQEILRKRLEEDKRLLTEPPSYLDKEKGKIRVPLEKAMALALAQLKSDKPRAAYPMTGEHIPQPAAAPTSPDKGAGSPKNGNINPTASNPTLNQASPAPAAAQSPTPASPGTTSTPPPAEAPGVNATPQVGTAATDAPAPTPMPPAANNNALNPGAVPASGAQPQPSPPPPGNSETSGASPTPSGAQPQPLTNPTSPTPPLDVPTVDPQAPGAAPGGTPA